MHQGVVGEEGEGRVSDASASRMSKSDFVRTTHEDERMHSHLWNGGKIFCIWRISWERIGWAFWLVYPRIHTQSLHHHISRHSIAYRHKHRYIPSFPHSTTSSCVPSCFFQRKANFHATTAWLSEPFKVLWIVRLVVETLRFHVMPAFAILQLMFLSHSTSLYIVCEIPVFAGRRRGQGHRMCRIKIHADHQHH
jgi:hypothetical protein